MWIESCVKTTRQLIKMTCLNNSVKMLSLAVIRMKEPRPQAEVANCSVIHWKELYIQEGKINNVQGIYGNHHLTRETIKLRKRQTREEQLKPQMLVRPTTLIESRI